MFNYLHKIELFTRRHRMPGAYFWIFPKLLIKHGMKDYCKNFNFYNYGEAINLLRNYLYECYQRVVLKGKTFSWELIKSGIPEGSVLGPLMFLICIKDLPNNIQSACKTFADDTSLFSHVFNKYRSQSELNKDLQAIRNWAY